MSFLSLCKPIENCKRTGSDDASFRCAVVSMQGLRRENEDRYVMLPQWKTFDAEAKTADDKLRADHKRMNWWHNEPDRDRYAFFGVFDGYCGTVAAEYVSTALPAEWRKSVPLHTLLGQNKWSNKDAARACLQVDHDLNKDAKRGHDGSTAAFVIMAASERRHVFGNVGNSRILCYVHRRRDWFATNEEYEKEEEDDSDDAPVDRKEGESSGRGTMFDGNKPTKSKDLDDDRDEPEEEESTVSHAPVDENKPTKSEDQDEQHFSSRTWKWHQPLLSLTAANKQEAKRIEKSKGYHEARHYSRLFGCKSSKRQTLFGEKLYEHDESDVNASFLLLSPDQQPVTAMPELAYCEPGDGENDPDTLHVLVTNGVCKALTNQVLMQHLRAAVSRRLTAKKTKPKATLYSSLNSHDLADIAQELCGIAVRAGADANVTVMLVLRRIPTVGETVYAPPVATVESATTAAATAVPTTALTTATTTLSIKQAQKRQLVEKPLTTNTSESKSKKPTKTDAPLPAGMWSDFCVGPYIDCLPVVTSELKVSDDDAYCSRTDKQEWIRHFLLNLQQNGINKVDDISHYVAMAQQQTKERLQTTAHSVADVGSADSAAAASSITAIHPTSSQQTINARLASITARNRSFLSSRPPTTSHTTNGTTKTTAALRVAPITASTTSSLPAPVTAKTTNRRKRAQSVKAQTKRHKR